MAKQDASKRYVSPGPTQVQEPFSEHMRVGGQRQRRGVVGAARGRLLSHYDG